MGSAWCKIKKSLMQIRLDNVKQDGKESGKAVFGINKSNNCQGKSTTETNLTALHCVAFVFRRKES